MKKNKIVNKIGILVLAVMLSILSSITVLASEPEEAELGPRQDISKNLTTGEITVNEIPANLNKNSSDVMEPFIPEGMKVDPTTREVIGPDNRYRITDTTAYPNSAICYMEMKFPDDDGLYVGTAWMYGERVAMTAGHCVYDASLGGWAEWVRIYPGSNGGTSPYGVHYASVLHTDTKYEFERNARTAEAEQSKRAASRVKPTEPDRAGKQSAQRSVGDVERELRGIDEAVKSRTSKGRAEQAERRRAEQEAHQRAEAERRAAEEQQRIASRRYIGRDWEPER